MEKEQFRCLMNEMPVEGSPIGSKGTVFKWAARAWIRKECRNRRFARNTKSHERTACQERTIRFTPTDESPFPVLGYDKSFVTFRETFVSRRAAETPEGWRLRERQRPSLLESSDARAASNRPSGRFRGGVGFRGSREAPVRLHEHKPFSCGIKRCCDAASYSPVMPHHI